jgi:type IV secretory pathway TrbF-like protein/sugar phosphate permease
MEYPRAGVVILLPFIAGYYLSYLFRTINALIADRLAAELALTAAQLGLLTAAYFVTFAVIQLPLGVWLDRHGPRRVQSMLLSTAAVGATTFSLAGGFASLLIGRALMGLGAAGALMAGLKAIALWFPKERATLLNGLFITLGGLGAVTATAPAEAVLDMTGWRGLFVMLAPVTALCAAAVFLLVPDPMHRTTRSSDAARLRRSIGLKGIFTDPRFWRLAPLSATCIGTSWALQGLWAAAWLADVERLDRADVVRCLFVMALALCAAALGLGLAADRLRRRGIPVQSLLVCAALFSIAAQFALILRWPLPLSLLWSTVAGMGAGTVLSFAALAEEFPAESIGRANGALNVLHLGGAFIAQSGIGLIVQQWPSADGRYPAAAYQVALAFSLALQVAAVFWFICPDRSASRKPPVMGTASSGLRDGGAIEPVTAFQRAAETWDDRFGSVAVQAANWRLAAIAAMALTGLLGVTLAVAASRAAAVIYRVDIGPRDERVIVAETEPLQPSDAQIAYVLKRFIENIRGLSSDPIVVRSNWHDAYAHLTDRGAEELNSYARAADVFAKIGTRTVSVEVISVVRASDRVFAIRWVESAHENGLQIAADRFSAVIEIVFEPGRTSETLLANPLGLYVHSIAWSHA